MTPSRHNLLFRYIYGFTITTILKMKKIVLLAALAGIAFAAKAQEDVYVDFKAVKTEIENKQSSFYYEKLEQRLASLDSTLTGKELYHLYYGSSLVKKDKAQTDMPERIKTLLNTEERSAAEKLELLGYYEQQFAANPMASIAGLRSLVIWYGENGYEANGEKAGMIYQKLLQTILTTGSGTDIESAIDVVSVDDEYTFVRIFRMESKGQALLHEKDRSYDVLSCEDEGGNKYSVYFDVTRVFEIYEEAFKGKE